MTFPMRLAPLYSGFFLAAAFAQTGPAGHWEGTVQLPDRELQMMFDIAKDAKGAWIGSFSQPGQGVRNLPLNDLKVEEKSVKFRLAGGANSPSIDCTSQATDAMKCTLTGPGGSVDATMKRTGEAKVELPASSPAVSAALEGNWEGALDTPNGTLRLVVHFVNQPDKTVKATVDSPDQGAMGLPLSEVVEKGSAVEFQLRIAGGGFKGTLKEGQLVGDWSQGGGSLPLTLKKAK
jgi:hypothetical protein